LLDEIDHKILEILQEKGRLRRNELAEAVGLSLPSASERLHKLEEQKIISGYHAFLDYRSLGKDITAFIFVAVDSSRHYTQFIEHAVSLDDVLECHAITGEGTHLLKARTTNTAALEKLLSRIQSWAGVVSTKTHLVLSTRKETTKIRIEHTNEPNRPR
jgi:Lrp/AsnC family transcriptional regulator, leucine-responsive regulatory protein